MGAVAFDLLLALVITSLVRVRLGYRSWKAIHWLAYACWPLALVHGLGTGSDTRAIWMLALVGVSVAAVIGAVWWRAYGVRPPQLAPRLAAVGATAIGSVAVAAWLVAGPLAPGWATTAGTPAQALAAGGARQAPPATLPSTSAFSAQASEQPGAGGAVVLDIVGTLDTSAMPIEIVLDGTATSGGLAVQHGRVSLGTPSNRYAGTIDSLADGRISARLTDAAGAAVDIDLTLQILDQAGTTQGTVRLTPVGSSA